MSISPSSGGSSRKRGRGQMDDAPRDASGRRIFTVEIDGRTCVFSGASEPRLWYEEEDGGVHVYNRGVPRVPMVPEHESYFFASAWRRVEVGGSSEPPRRAVYRMVPPSLVRAHVVLHEEDPERREQKVDEEPSDISSSKQEVDEEPSDISSSKRARVPASSKAIQGLREARPVDEGMPAECAVCLQDFEADDKLRAMPCSHAFHQRCIFEWLRRNGVCPLCRQPLPPGDDEEEEDSQLQSTPVPEAD